MIFHIVNQTSLLFSFPMHHFSHPFTTLQLFLTNAFSRWSSLGAHFGVENWYCEIWRCALPEGSLTYLVTLRSASIPRVTTATKPQIYAAK